MSGGAALFLKNLPSRNKRNFTIRRDSEEIKTDEEKTEQKIAWHVPQRPDERVVKNDRVPLLLRYLEKNYGLKKTITTKGSSATTSKAAKRKDSDDEQERNNPKTRRVGDNF